MPKLTQLEKEREKNENLKKENRIFKQVLQDKDKTIQELRKDCDSLGVENKGLQNSIDRLTNEVKDLKEDKGFLQRVFEKVVDTIE